MSAVRGALLFSIAAALVVVAPCGVATAAEPSASASASASTVPAPAPTDGPSAVTPSPAPVLRTSSPSAAETIDRTTVVLHGTGLGAVRAVLLGGRVLPGLRHRADGDLEVEVPPAPRFWPSTAAFGLRTSRGNVATRLRWRWTERGSRAKELRWVQANAASRTYPWGHPYIPGEDCANFASRALRVRGLPLSVLQTSSTALRDVLVHHLGATELPDSAAARRRVRVGDVVQFDWWPSPLARDDRDHTGIVSAVEPGAHGSLTVRYIAHTDPLDAPAVGITVEASLREPGHDPRGRVFFLLLP